MTSVQQQSPTENQRSVVKVRASDVAFARLKIVTSRRLGESVPEWVEKLANAKPEQR